MKLSEFISLPAAEKKIVLLHMGVLIGKRKEKDVMVFLFWLCTYYVEMYCQPDTKNVESFHVFDSMVPLRPYLEAIEISDLFS